MGKEENGGMNWREIRQVKDEVGKMTRWEVFFSKDSVSFSIFN